MLPASADRVPRHTDKDINEKIRLTTNSNVACFASAGSAAIDRRLSELDREWDIERTLEANASSLSLIGLLLGFTVNHLWFLFPVVIAAFLLQHALQGWCPPVPIFRRLGFRTRTEIDYERYALKAIRGDFNQAPKLDGRDIIEEVQRVMKAVQS